MISQDQMHFLATALELAREAKGGVSPRPAVGAVVEKNGEVLGQGQTEPRPGAHAEVAAIRSAGASVEGATLYCTLEPHAHQGVAPPCTEQIIDAGIKKVVCPIEDPNPQVNGNGFRRLRSAGVEVVTDVPPELRHEAEEIISGFKTLLEQGRPQFTLKYAMSLDGRIATSTGESQWITGEQARAEAHRLRHGSDAIVTGIGTVLADNPRMSARTAAGVSSGRPRIRVVLDTGGRLPTDAAILDEPGEVLWVLGKKTRRDAPAENVSVVNLPLTDEMLDLHELAAILAERDVCDAMIESGGTLAGSFIQSGLVDKIAAFIGPLIIGGEKAPGPVGGQGIASLADGLRLENVRQKMLGNDLMVTGDVNRDLD